MNRIPYSFPRSAYSTCRVTGRDLGGDHRRNTGGEAGNYQTSTDSIVVAAWCFLSWTQPPCPREGILVPLLARVRAVAPPCLVLTPQ